MTWDSISEALAVREPNPAAVELFEAAGFDTERARRGAMMLVSGRYLGFSDAATSLLEQHPDSGRTVRPDKIAAVAERANREAAERLLARTASPWGTKVAPVQEAQRRTPWGRPVTEAGAGDGNGK